MITRRSLLRGAGAAGLTLGPMRFVRADDIGQKYFNMLSNLLVSPAYGAVYFDNGQSSGQLPTVVVQGSVESEYGPLPGGQLPGVIEPTYWSFFSALIAPTINVQQSMRIATWTDPLTSQEVKAIEILPPGRYPQFLLDPRTNSYTYTQITVPVLHIAVANHLGVQQKFMNWYGPLPNWFWNGATNLLQVVINPDDYSPGSTGFIAQASVSQTGGTSTGIPMFYGMSDLGPGKYQTVFAMPWVNNNWQVNMHIGLALPGSGGIPFNGILDNIQANAFHGFMDSVIWEQRFPVYNTVANNPGAWIDSSGMFIPPPVGGGNLLGPDIAGPPVFLTGGIGPDGFLSNKGGIQDEPGDVLIMDTGDPSFVVMDPFQGPQDINASDAQYQNPYPGPDD